MSKESLLIEIGTEELPPVHLDTLGQNWLNLFKHELDKVAIPYGSAHFYIAPRRLALYIQDIPRKQEDRTISKKGPSLKAAFDDAGNPSKAALGFAAANKTSVENLSRIETDEGSWLACDIEEKGRTVGDWVKEILPKTLQALPIQKKMRWADKQEAFIRPVHWCVALHGADVIPLSLFGIQSSNESMGHRVHHPAKVTITHADSYLKLMREAFVLADYTERKQIIFKQVTALAISQHAQAKIDPELLDLVTGLNEWPTPMLASFDASFLKVPQEALITSMQHHQKCFPMLDEKGNMKAQFILVSNTDPESSASIVHGNERVMHARLSDARFFYEQDLKNHLSSQLENLKKVVFQKKLGTLNDKSMRLKKLATKIAPLMDGDLRLTERAALLSKCDLLTHMVLEFPELQGIMGSYYALHNGEPEEVATAIKEAYYPRFSGDSLPESLTGLILSLTERLDTVVGIYGIGKVPTGDSDPFALKRAAIGILRILVEKQYDLDLNELIEMSVSCYHSKVSPEAIPKILHFIFERFNSLFEEKGIHPKVLEAVTSLRQPTRPLDFSRRIEAVENFQKLPEAETLASANKRIRNILTKSGIKMDAPQSPEVNEEFLIENAERDLNSALLQLKRETAPLLSKGDYTAMLTQLVSLKEPVDAFFDSVMVNVDDENVRQNRLHLLINLHTLLSQVADLSKL